MIKKQKRIRAFFLAGMMCFFSVQNVVAVAQESSNEIPVAYTEEIQENTVAETDTETEINTEPETEFVTEAVTESYTEVVIDTETESQTDTVKWTEESTEEIQTDTETESERLSEEITDSEAETQTESDTETETESDILDETEDEDDRMMLLDMTQRPSGTAIANTSGWKAVTSGTRFSSQYRPVKFYNGVSKLELFNTSSQVTIGTTSSGKKYFYPKRTGQGGKFGAIYRKVLYYNHKWYDLKMTVTNYTSEVHCDGGGKTESYPFILMLPDAIEWRFNQALGGLVMKCEFLENGSGNKAAVNTRFQWWDVDGGQRFGIKNENGSIAGRYYYSGSGVYVQKGQSIAGVGNLEMVVGQGDDTPTSDPRYCVTYELANCSSYYMAIGPRDHIDQDDYSYSKTRLKEMNTKLANGQASNADGNETLQQTDSSLSIIDTPAPEKKVSLDGKNWDSQIALHTPADSYWYQVGQFVPWQDRNAYYQAFAVKDNLPVGVTYVGNVKIVREEDGADMTGNFTVEQKGQSVTISAKSAALSGKSFYGYHYLIRFQVKWNLSVLKPVYSQNTGTYKVRNIAAVQYRHSTESTSTEKKSNEVMTTSSISRKEQESPVKYLDLEIQKKEKNLLSEDEEIVFAVQQKLPENETSFLPEAVILTDQLENCLELQTAAAEIQKKGSSKFEPIQNTQIQNQENKITIKVPFIAAYNGGTMRFQMKCKLRKNVDLTGWTKKEGDGSSWIKVPNEASVALQWNAGSPTSVSKKTNQVLVKLRIHHIRLTKEIQAEDIVWAHGNPTFTFKVQGTDTNGKQHVYYQTVVFQKQNTASMGKVNSTAEFIVPAGIYEASEEKTMRYHLKEIQAIVNGTRQNNQVCFTLQNGGDGSAVFCNEKVTDQEESHTDFVRNVIRVKR